MHKNQAKDSANGKKGTEKEAPGKAAGDRNKEYEAKDGNQESKDGAVVGDINGEGKRTRKAAGKTSK